jgi:hypothetical protein
VDDRLRSAHQAGKTREAEQAEQSPLEPAVFFLNDILSLVLRRTDCLGRFLRSHRDRRDGRRQEQRRDQCRSQ